MVKKPSKKVTKNKNLTRREMVMGAVIAVLLFLFLWMWFAARNGWWPSNNSRSRLNAAQVREIADEASEDTPAAATQLDATNNTTPRAGNSNTSTTPSGGTSSSGNSSSGTGGGGGGSGGGNNGGTTTPSNPDAGFLTFSANMAAGQTKNQLTAMVGNLSQSCTLSLDTGLLGKQEICVYRQGTKIITVTLLNDRIISIARTGF